MAFYINTNIASLQAQDYLNQTQNFQNQTIQEVTSGLRIVNSGDDAAGLAIANSYRSDEAVLTQGIQNANDGLSQLQIADGGISNISQLLDRARTLATESASGTFTGNRGVLNSEFQSVLTEINRQAQSIGLNQGGTFAKNLTTFIGGGQASNGVSATQNGTISLNLASSTVDAASLGLAGVQAAGAAGTDIGPGSANTSLANILSNATNTASEATPGYTTFYVKGPGFGNGITLSVNTANLGSTSDLVAAVNSAITAAGSAGTQQATAFQNANITAAINTDANGGQQLVFNSSTAAFQVQAGDQLSNALLGNFAQNASITGSDANATVTLGGPSALTLSVNGATPISVNFSAGTYSKADIVKALNGNANFNAVATATLQGNQITIQSNNNSATSSVGITSTTLATDLGLSTNTATAASASTGASLDTQVTAADNTAAGATTFGKAGAGTITFQFQGGGLTSPASVSLNVTANETVDQAIAALNTAVSSNASLKTAGISLTTSTATNALTFTSTNGQSFSVGATGDTQNLLGFGSFVAGANNAFDYSTLTGNTYNSGVSGLNPGGTAAGTANFEFSIGGGASAANNVSVDLGGGDATAATETAATAVANPFNVDSTNDQLNLFVNGTAVTVNLTHTTDDASTATLNDVANQISNQLNTTLGAGVASASVVNNHLTITTTNKGANQSIEVAAGSANATLGLAATDFQQGTARSGASIAAALNTAFSANSTLQAAGLTASFAAGQLTVNSSNGTFFRADAYSSTPSTSAEVAGTAQVGSNALAAQAIATNAIGSPLTVNASNDTLTVNVNNTGNQTITLAHGSFSSDQIVEQINAQITGATASVDSNGHIELLSNVQGAGPASRINLATAAAATGTAAISSNHDTYSIAAATSAAAVGTTDDSAGYSITSGTNDTIKLKVDGGAWQTVTLQATDTTAADVVNDLNTVVNGGLGLTGATAKVYTSGGKDYVEIVSNSTGSSSSVDIDTSVAHDAAASVLGLANGTVTGTNGNNQLSLSVDGGPTQTVSLTTGTRTAAEIASDINTLSNGGTGLIGATASAVNIGGQNYVQILSNTTGAATTISFNGVANNADTVLGFLGSPYANGTDAVDTAAASLGYTVGQTNTNIDGSAASANVNITTGVNDTLNLAVDGTTASVTFAAGATTAAAAANQINTQLNAQLGTVGLNYATVSNGRIQLASQTTGANSSVQVLAGDANSTFGFSVGTTNGTAADVGFGTSGETFTGNVATTAPTASPTIDSGGASQTSALSFTPILNGSDQQTITITAPDASGVQQSLAVNLSNNATSRNGSSIDQAINAINTALQQSNNSTLNQIVAVKDDSSGTEKIRFLSTLNSFQVAVGTTGDGTGVGSQGTTAASTVSAGGSSAEIADITGANAAVNALANAVTALGNAQAVVGRGENQFNYAINLAQSQLTNTTAAESTIRDADLAAESANLTKSQIQLQAGIAALAQANSAPQQILKLLQ